MALDARKEYTHVGIRKNIDTLHFWHIEYRKVLHLSLCLFFCGMKLFAISWNQDFFVNQKTLLFPELNRWGLVRTGLCMSSGNFGTIQIKMADVDDRESGETKGQETGKDLWWLKRFLKEILNKYFSYPKQICNCCCHLLGRPFWAMYQARQVESSRWTRLFLC